jgi:hypothetical protein
MLFEKLINDLFSHSQYSRNELDLFTVDHLRRLEKIDSPYLSKEDIEATKTKHKVFKDHLGVLSAQVGGKQGGTVSRQDAYDDVLDFIRNKEGAVKSEFNKGSGPYTEFYPAGLSEYNNAKVEGLKDLLVRYVTVANKYKDRLGQKFVDNITNLQTAYSNARDDQSGSIAGHKTTQTKVRDARKELTLQLTRNVLQVASHTVEMPNAFLGYFNFGLLNADNPNSKPPKEEEKKA